MQTVYIGYTISKRACYIIYTKYRKCVSFLSASADFTHAEYLISATARIYNITSVQQWMGIIRPRLYQLCLHTYNNARDYLIYIRPHMSELDGWSKVGSSSPSKQRPAVRL
jgi:hypothetical protein